MARILLLSPPYPAVAAAPLLSQQSLAASLLAAGHEVRIRALSARGEAVDRELEDAARRDPDVIGITVFTGTALEAYALAGRLRGAGRRLVAGGPHATACPEEPLSRGFDAVVRGEGERTLPALIAAWDGRTGEPGKLPGVVTPGGRGVRPHPIRDLDALPPRTDALRPEVCGESVAGAAVGLIASRGCPSACTFCARDAAGRPWRPRAPGSVVAEMRILYREHGVRVFPFWDDAFAADSAHLAALCDAMRGGDPPAGTPWTCFTPADGLGETDLVRMRDAGCVSVVVGAESGDERILASIGKRARPDRVIAAVRNAKRLGMTTVVNVMAGFPGEGAAELDRTLALMEALAPDTDFFNPHGVVVPFPGTVLYERWHRKMDFTGWWLDPERRPRLYDPGGSDPEAGPDPLSVDPVLECDFFRYAPAVRKRIEGIVRAKAAHNAVRTGQIQSIVANRLLY